MLDFKRLIDKLRAERSLSAEELRQLIDGYDDETLVYAAAAARAVTEAHFGDGVYLRGLIEVSSRCRNDCRYCGLRRSNRRAERYRLEPEEILAACTAGYRAGLRTFVLQGGEDPALTDALLVPLIAEIHRRWPDCALTLSLGERSDASYEALYAAGATRYLLRHETIDEAHYRLLHPDDMSLARRLACLDALRRIGYQTGTGMMIGAPGQTAARLAADVAFIARFRPHMIGIGPFVPQHDTPFGREPAGSVRTTLLLISVLRLLAPRALIPATTALATLDPEGRQRGILAGANVVMPNLSPCEVRRKYAIYDGKAAAGCEAVEGLASLTEELAAIGRRPSFARGDYGDRHDAGHENSDNQYN